MQHTVYNSNALAEAAVQYAEAGQVVFPVRSDRKRPRVKWGELEAGPEHGEQVRRWWALWPTAHIGLRTGGGLVVLDVDPRHNGQVDPSWPETLIASTPSGGVHLFYSTDAPIRNSASVVAPGVDVRGERGFVVVPPSPGRKWLNEGTAIAELPVALVSLCLGAAYGRNGQRNGAGNLPGSWRPYEPPLPEQVRPGERNETLLRLAGWLRSQELSEPDILDFLHAYNDEMPQPLDRDEVDSVAGRYA